MRFVRLLVFVCVVLLTGCDYQAFVPIPKQMEALISVNIKEGSVTFFDLKSEKKYAQWDLKQPIKGGALLENGKTLLLYGNELDRAYAYDLETGKIKSEWKIGKGIVSALVSNDEKHVFLADQRQKERKRSRSGQSRKPAAYAFTKRGWDTLICY